MPLVQNAGPATRPVDFTDLAAHVRISGTDDTTLVNTYIDVATNMVQNYLGRSLVSQTWKLFLNDFPDCCRGCGNDKCRGCIILQRPPIISVDAVKYLEPSAGATTTLATTVWQAQLYGPRPYVTLKWSQTFPMVQLGAVNAAWVEYTAGYATVPEDIKQAIRMIVASLFEGREVYAPGMKLESLTSFPILAMMLKPHQVFIC